MIGGTRRRILGSVAPEPPSPRQSGSREVGVPRGFKTDENAAQGPACDRVSRTLTSVRGDTRICVLTMRASRGPASELSRGGASAWQWQSQPLVTTPQTDVTEAALPCEHQVPTH